MPDSPPRPLAVVDPTLIVTKGEFADALRSLKGKTSYKEILDASVRLAAARRPPEPWAMVKLPKGTVAGILSAKNLPSVDVLVTYLRVLEVSSLQIKTWLAVLNRIRSPKRTPRRNTSRPISEHDPIDLGVHRATNASDDPIVADLPLLPPFVHRVHDARMRRELDDTAHNKMLILVGKSSTGKTRSCYEAVTAELPSWELQHPANADLLSTIVTEGIAPHTVLWLNETQTYLGHDVAVAALHKLLTDGVVGPVIVVGSMWPSHWSRLTRRPEADEQDLGGSVRALLSLRKVVKINVPDDFSTATKAELVELGRLAGTDPRLAAAVRTGAENFMITQNLAGGPLLVDRYQNHLDAHAKAIMSAAMDAVRLGHYAPIRPILLEESAKGYLNSAQRVAAPDWFSAAIASCIQEENGIRPLTPVRVSEGTGAADGYILHDYLVQHAVTSRRRKSIPNTTWIALSARAYELADVIRLAHSADCRGRYRHAITLFRRGADADTSGSAAARLTRLLVDQGDVEMLQAAVEAGDLHAAAALARIEVAKSTERKKQEYDSIPAKERTSTLNSDYLDDVETHKVEKFVRELGSTGDIDGLRVLAETGDRSAAGYLISTLLQQKDETDLRQLADSGDKYATAALIRLLTQKMTEDDLRNLIKKDDEYAPAGLFLKFVQDGDIDAAIDVLHPYVEAGEPGAAERLAALQIKTGNIAAAISALRPAAQAGDLACGRKLSFLLYESKDIDGLRERADSGDRYAARLVVDILAQTKDIDGLQAELNAGNSDDAVRALLDLQVDMKEW